MGAQPIINLSFQLDLHRAQLLERTDASFGLDGGKCTWLKCVERHKISTLSYVLPSPFQIGKDVEVTDREMRQRFQIGTEEGPVEGLDVPPRGDGPEVDNCLFWFADGGYFSDDYPVGPQ